MDIGRGRTRVQRAGILEIRCVLNSGLGQALETCHSLGGIIRTRRQEEDAIA